MAVAADASARDASVSSSGDTGAGMADAPGADAKTTDVAVDALQSSGGCAAGEKRCGGKCSAPSPGVGCSFDDCVPCPAPVCKVGGGAACGAAVCSGLACDIACDTGLAKISGACWAGSCADSLENNNETDVDCGGSCPKCPTGSACKSNADCRSQLCVVGQCLSPSACDSGRTVPVDIYFMFDQSLSMACAIPPVGDASSGDASGGDGSGGDATAPGADRWTAVKTALEQFVSAPTGMLNVAAGIQYFGLGGSGVFASCNPADYQNPDVEIAQLPGNGSAMKASLEAHGPSTNTPTKPALEGAIDHAVAWKATHAGHAVVVVLVTDGQPNACGTIAEVAAVAASGFSGAGISTYVIGVTSPGSACALDPNPPNGSDLDKVAAAGGTKQVGSPGTELEFAL